MFDAVAGANVGGPEGRAEWAACSSEADLPSSAPRPPASAPTARIPLLDDELAAQTGDDSGRSTVAILPTIRVLGRQYRGGLSAGSVLRALCAAFPPGGEPRVCTEAWVSEDECAEGGDGWRACGGRWAPRGEGVGTAAGCGWRSCLGCRC